MNEELQKLISERKKLDEEISRIEELEKKKKDECKKEGIRLIAEKMKSVKTLIMECETIAEEYEVAFAGPMDVYGMGGTYYPGSGWSSSSESC